MARKKFETLTPEQELTQVTCTDDLIANYVRKKQELEILDKLVKKLGEEVKKTLAEQGLKSTERNGFKVTRLESQRITWNEEALLAKVKTFNKPELIKQVEQVDVPMLQQAIIDDQIKANDIMDCQTVTKVVSLRMDKIKKADNNEL